MRLVFVHLLPGHSKALYLMSGPLVSVAAINYNNAAFVIETLDSIKNQTHPNIELVIVDDCSTDNSVALINQWLQSYTKPHKFIRHEVNKGVCMACNSGLHNTTGKYFSLIGTDDVMMPEKIARQVEILEATADDIAAVYSNADLIDVQSLPLEGSFIQRHRQFTEMPSGNLYEMLLQGNFLPAMSLLIKRKVFEDVGEFDEELAYEDYDMWLRISRKYKIIFSDFVSVRYRIRPTSLTFSIKNWHYSNIKIFLKHLDAPLPLRWLRDTVYHAYSLGDDKALALIRPLADSTKDKSLMAVYLLSKFGIAFSTGQKVIGDIKAHTEAKGTHIISDTGQSDTDIFINALAPCIETQHIKEIADSAYQNENKIALPLIKALADKTGNNYLKILSLLLSFNIPYTFGKLVLENLNEATNLTGISASYNEAAIFLNDILSALPRTVTIDVIGTAFNEAHTEMLLLLYNIGNKNGDLYLKAAWWQQHLHIDKEVGEAILKYFKNNPVAMKPNTSGSPYDTRFFYLEIAPAIPYDLLKMWFEKMLDINNKQQLNIIYKIAVKTGRKRMVLAYWRWRTKHALGISR